MARRITIPVKGGLYKSVRVDTQQSAGTTISGFDNQIITLDQLRAALGLNNKASVTPPSGGGGGSTGSLIVAPGLVGGGPLIGSVPLRINKAQAAAMFVGGGGDDDGGGGSVVPGKRGKDGVAGSTGPAGPAGTPGGPRGYPIALVTEPEEAPTPIPVRGRAGPPGAAGAAGPAGRTKIWLPENDYEEPMFVGRAKANAGSTTIATTLAAAILADSPFVFWKCDDASTALTDSSGNGFNLTTVVGTPTFQSGLLIPTLPSAQFINFAGYVATTTAHGFQLTSTLGRTFPFTTWTAEFVVSMFGSTTGIVRIIDWRTSVTTAILAIYNNGGPLSMALNNTNIPLLQTNIFGIGKPYHIIVTCSTAAGTSTLTSYINGVRYGASVTASASTASGGTSIIGLGDSTYGGATAGLTVGYVALFPTVLSAARIGVHAQAAGLLD